MKKLVQGWLALLLVALTHTAVFASGTGSMFCKGGIISTGGTASELLAKCGQPAYSTQREEKRVTDGDTKGTDKTIVTVAVDDWLYNFGPNQFQYRVILENGIVVRLESLDYGY